MYDKASLALIPSGYRDGELYSVLPANGDGDFNFGSGSTATRVNKDGLIETVGDDIPRLDYPLTNGVVGDCPHLLLEPQRTNHATYSNDVSQFNTLTVGGTLTQTANYASTPNGENEATRLQMSASGSNYALKGVVTSAFNDDYYISIYLKSNTTENQQVTIYGRNSLTQSYTVTPQWQRFEVACNNAAGSAFFYFGSRPSYNSNDDLDILAWGGQLEQGSYATSYIPTLQNQAESRSADICNGSGTSAEFNDNEGVLFAEISALANDGTTREIAISDGGASNRIEIRYISSANDIQAVIRGASATITLTYNVTDATEFTKVAVKYKSEDYALWVGGVERAVSTTSGTPTGLNEFAFDDGNGTFNMYGKCKQLIYFNEALSDSELQTLTS